jgi:hypothetical protein
MLKPYVKRVPRLKAFLEQEECDFEEWFDDLDNPMLVTQAAWLKGQTGGSELRLREWHSRWRDPGGQYKSLAVVVQTLSLVPMEERKQSRGAIVGASSGTGSGQWIKFLPEIMKEMGFTGSIDMWDVGLEEGKYQKDGLYFYCYKSYVETKDRYTWVVDDVFTNRLGPSALEGRYSSYKSSLHTPFFMPTEGRLFLVQGKEVEPQWHWDEGLCPCNRCCFERTLGEKTSQALRYFCNICTPGIDQWTRDIEVSWKFTPHYEAQNRTAAALAHMIKADRGLVDKVVVEQLPSQFERVHRVGQGPVEALPKGDGPVISETLVPESREKAYLPEADYKEWAPTSVFKDSKVLYERKPLPAMLPKDQATKKRGKDPYGRNCFGEVPIGYMWCWRECKAVITPHLCPDLDPAGRNKEFRGWKTFFRHLDRETEKDLCPICDRTIRSYYHKCNYGFVSDLDDETAQKALLSLYKEIPHEVSVWTPNKDAFLQSAEEDNGSHRFCLPQFAFLMSGRGSRVVDAVIDIVRDLPMTLPELHARLVKGVMSITKLRQLLKTVPELVFDESNGKWSTRQPRQWRVLT